MKRKIAVFLMVLMTSCFFSGLVHADLNDGLVAYYPFNRNANDESVNENNGTVNGATLTTGRFGDADSAYSFDGDDVILVPDAEQLDTITNTTDFSISLWLKFSSFPETENSFGLMQQYERDTNRWSLYIKNYEDKINIRLGYHDGAWHQILDSELPSPILNKWYNIIITRSENTWILFLNGQAINETNFSELMVNPSAPLDIGVFKYLYANNFFSGFSGIIDDIRIYNRALSEIEIQELFDNSTPTNTKPSANAGIDQSSHPGQVVTLDGSGCSDIDEDYPLTYAWKIIQKPIESTVELSDSTIVSPILTTDLPGDYIIQLTVTDSKGLSSEPDTVFISTFNTPPVADAGEDQAIIVVGSTVTLDGTQSYDIDGDTINYAWSILSTPEGSTTTLYNPPPATPTFVADIHGDYVFQLVVADQWSSSTPDKVTVSFDNVTAVADAGGNQSVVQGDTVSLDGSASTDANFDELTYSWSIVSKPEGSTAEIADPASVETSFVTDLPGEYVVSLVVNDGFLDSEASNISVMAITYQDATSEILQDTITTINDPAAIPNGAVKNKNLKNALTNKINSALLLIDQGSYEEALDKLQNDILGKTDGCATIGTPDKNDWIKDCDAQNQVYPLVVQTIEMLQNLIE